jgi:3-oxoadipate enol-lactonase
MFSRRYRHSAMPFTTAADGTTIHYEVTGRGDGPPLLLIQGLGADSRGWVLQQAALGRRFRCVSFDNRGVGRSDKPEGPYDLEEMADDAVAVLDAAGIESAHVMGASMGGVIAQILAVRHPERVRSLVLACTACRHQPWRRELLEDWERTAREQGMHALIGRSFRWLVGPRFYRRLALPVRLFGGLILRAPAHAFCAQIAAILAMSDDMRHELSSIHVPALIVVGTQDILTPLADSEELVERIPRAELHVIHGAAHALMVDRPHEFNHKVEDFLLRTEERRASASSETPAALLPLAGA